MKQASISFHSSTNIVGKGLEGMSQIEVLKASRPYRQLLRGAFPLYTYGSLSHYLYDYRQTSSSHSRSNAVSSTTPVPVMDLSHTPWAAVTPRYAMSATPLTLPDSPLPSSKPGARLACIAAHLLLTDPGVITAHSDSVCFLLSGTCPLMYHATHMEVNRNELESVFRGYLLPNRA